MVPFNHIAQLIDKYLTLNNFVEGKIVQIYIPMEANEEDLVAIEVGILDEETVANVH